MMLTFRRILSFVCCAFFFLILTIQPSNSLAETPFGPRPQKNPKLSTPLVLLSENIPQAKVRPATPEEIRPPQGFSKENLPKPLKDAIHAGQLKITDRGEVQVYIEMNSITPQNLDQLRSYGVNVQIIGKPKPDKSKREVLTKVPTVQGLLPITMINQVSTLSFVRYIRLPDYGFTNTGAVESQGDAILQAEAARNQFGLDGTGIRVGVISDGIGGIFATGCTSCGPTGATPSPINSSDLPSATGTRNSSGTLISVSGGITAQSFRADENLEACNGTCDTSGLVGAEGTAMLEIVHDLAPGAKLYFANFDTSLSFEQAVDYLATNTDVSVDDISWQTPPFDGTNSVSTNTATNLNTDANPIRGYFTAVANQVFDHWAESWTGAGVTSILTCPSGVQTTGDVQLFQATSNTADFRSIGPHAWDPLVVPNGAILQIFLTWNDPFDASSNDYDAYLYLLSGNALASSVSLACSVNPQTGTQTPVEHLIYQNTSGTAQSVGILVQNVNNAAVARNFDLFVTGICNCQDLNFYTPSGSVPAESDAGGSPVSVVSVGAIDQAQCTASDSCTGSVEPYSSQGPTEATPQAQARMKPDVTAADDVIVTGAGGFGMNGPNGSATAGCAIGETPCFFAGSSAAAPHVAAVAALTLQAAPCLLSTSTVNQPATARANLRNFITSTAVALPGVSQTVPNNIEGFGLVNALAAITAALPKPNAGTAQTIDASSTNGASVNFSGSASDPDSCPVTLNWAGSCGAASGATASLMCPVGNDTETLTASNGGVTASLPTSSVQIAVSDFSLASPQGTATVKAGQSATYTISVGQQFGAFTNAVSLTCSGLPSLTSCSFLPSSVTPGSGSTTSTLTITTTAPSLMFPARPSNRPTLPVVALWLTVFLTLITAALWAKRENLKFAFRFASCVLLTCIALAIVSCGSGSKGPSNPGTPAGTYTLSVTGSSNQLQHSVNVTLTVQ